MKLLWLLLCPAAQAQDDAGESEESDDDGEASDEDSDPPRKDPDVSGGWAAEPVETPHDEAEPPPGQDEPPDQDEPEPTDEEADEDWGDEDWGGGNDVGFAESDVEAPSEDAPTPWPVTPGGILRTDEALWLERLDDQPWAKARQTVDLWVTYKQDWLRAQAAVHGEIDLVYYIPETDDSDPATLDEYGNQLRPDELWAAAALGPWEITAGRQVVPWGQGLLLSPLDVTNPRDMREPGLADLEDIRLPVTMLRVGYFTGSHRFEVMAVPEAHFGYRATPSGPFGPAKALLGRVTDDFFAGYLEQKTYSYEHLQEGWDPANLQGFARWTWKGRGLDLGGYAASVLDRNGNIVLPDIPDGSTFEGLQELTAFLQEPTMVLGLDHQRYTMLGTSGAAPQGDFLLRWEASTELGRRYDTADLANASQTEPPEIIARSTNAAIGMVSVGYAGLPRTSIDVEVAQLVFVDGRPKDLLFPVDQPQLALRLNHMALRERLSLDVVGLGVGLDLGYGWLARASATYELRDSLHAKLGVITYRPPSGDVVGPLLGLGEHDRLFAQLRYDF